MTEGRCAWPTTLMHEPPREREPIANAGKAATLFARIAGLHPARIGTKERLAECYASGFIILAMGLRIGIADDNHAKHQALRIDFREMCHQKVTLPLAVKVMM